MSDDRHELVYQPPRAARLRAVAYLLVVSLLVAAVAAVLAAREIGALRTAVTAQCKFDSDLGGVPVSVNPGTGKASLLGVQIISDSRRAWRGLGCPGKLAPPAPSFARWARYYHLPQ